MRETWRQLFPLCWNHWRYLASSRAAHLDQDCNNRLQHGIKQMSHHNPPAYSLYWVLWDMKTYSIDQAAWTSKCNASCPRDKWLSLETLLLLHRTAVGKKKHLLLAVHKHNQQCLHLWWLKAKKSKPESAQNINSDKKTMSVQAVLTCTSRAHQDCEQADNSSHQFCTGVLVGFCSAAHSAYKASRTKSKKRKSQWAL